MYIKVTTIWHLYVSRQIRFLPIGLVSWPQPFQLPCSLVWGRPLCEAFHMREPAYCDDVRSTFKSRKSASFDCSVGCPPVEMLSPWSGQAGYKKHSRVSQPRPQLPYLRGLRLSHYSGGAKEACDRYLQTWRKRVCLRFNYHRLMSVGILVGEVPQEERRCESSHSLWRGGAGSEVLSHHQRIGSRFKGNERNPPWIRSLLYFRPCLP